MKIGIDIVKIERFSNLSKKSCFEIFTKDEIRYAQKFKLTSKEHFAGFFACKEAVMKALGMGITTLSPKDIEIIHDKSGKPKVVLWGKPKNVFDDLFYSQIEVSISHTKDIAIAVCQIY